MKKIGLFLLCILTLFAFFSSSVNVYAQNGEFSWFCGRYGNNQPPISKEETLINKYGGFSVDRDVCDGSEKRVIYLTFDAGYENGNVERILNVLKEERVQAAFFLLDNIILKNTDLVTRMSEEGHLVCNHTKNHKNLCNATFEEIEKDVLALEAIYKANTGKKMDKFFRFPEGRYSEEALECVGRLGYRSVFWSFAYDDWDNSRQPDREKAVKKILSNTHNGAIFLFHPTSEVNADIFPTLISEWRKMGYEFGSLRDIA
jgi:peptidoglycan-N-acetylmuramic acid deacetylase